MRYTVSLFNGAIKYDRMLNNWVVMCKCIGINMIYRFPTLHMAKLALNIADREQDRWTRLFS